MWEHHELPEHLGGLRGLITRQSVSGDALKIFKAEYSEPYRVFLASIQKPDYLTVDVWKAGEQENISMEMDHGFIRT